MGKSKKRKEASKQASEATRGVRRTRKGGKDNVEHMHAELLVVGERIVQLRADLDRKAADAKEAMSEVYILGEELARFRDSMDGPNQILRQKMCRLKG